ncbi:MAG: hypothetical protein JW894_08245 [Bacteroidales bacterium]|nr:hypothetical protein [Bacteroidales bacterium]
MKNKKVIAILLTSAVLFSCSFAQVDISSLIKDFVSEDWKTVQEAKIALENLEGEAIPDVIPLLDRDETVKLKNTGSLIYPGAQRFFGHGQIVDYAIDNLSIRAGWLLEELTFNNFGFTGLHLPDEELVGFIKITFPDYYNNSQNRKKIESSAADELRNLIHKLCIAEAKTWWKAESGSWTRLQALVDGLHSFDEKRQVKALFYMRNGKTRCTGLDKDYYIDNISSLIVRLSSSDTKRVSEHARFILFDTQFTWLDDKLK